MNDVAKNLKKIRMDSGITQEALAEKMYVTRQTISNWETGKSQPDMDALTSLAEVLSVDITELIYGRKNQYPRFQKKYMITAIISLCAIITVIVLERTLYVQLVENVRTTFTGSFELTVYDFSVKPLGFLALGVFLTALLSLWVDTRLEKKVRIVILIVGIVAFIFAFWLLVEIILMYIAPNVFPGFIFLSPVYASTFLRMIFLIAMPLISGAALFLGFNRREKKQ